MPDVGLGPWTDPLAAQQNKRENNSTYKLYVHAQYPSLLLLEHIIKTSPLIYIIMYSVTGSIRIQQPTAMYYYCMHTVEPLYYGHPLGPHYYIIVS